MLSTPHVAVGAAIAVAIPNPLISIPLAIGSHFLLDSLPHWNPHMNTDLKKYGKVTSRNTNIVIADSVTALLLGSVVAYSYIPDTARSLAILLTCFSAVLPDLVEAPHYFMGHRNELVNKYIAWQKSIQFDVAPVPGLAVQAIVILVSLWTI